jgi:hypothetical protein
MEYTHDAYGDSGGAGDRGDRAAAERAVRAGLDEIRQAIDQLERICRRGKITETELAEERDLLRAQDESLRRNME